MLDSGEPVMFTSSACLFNSLRQEVRSGKPVKFHGAYNLPENSLISDSQQVCMVTQDIWKTTGYCFTEVFKISIALLLLTDFK